MFSGIGFVRRSRVYVIQLPTAMVSLPRNLKPATAKLPLGKWESGGA
jgi:hypothetical protein